jgi:transglutaminase-like putative cysteine protease
VQLVPTAPAPASYHLADWNVRSTPERMRFMREVAEDAAQDTRLRAFAVDIISADGFEARAYEKHAAALLRWVQANIKYVNETGEIIQHPLKTLDLGFGDCDDSVSLLAALFGAVGLPWRFVLAGHGGLRGKTAARWIEGTREPRGVDWKHIYLVVGWPAFDPKVWRWADPSVADAPLGWDVFAPPRQRNDALTGLGDGTGTAPVDTTGTRPPWFDLLRDIFLYASAGVISAVVSTLVLDRIKHRR